MASKKIEIEVGVKTDQLDQATNKVGELKKLSNKISIQYDINGKPLDIVIDKSLNLKKQVVELTKALRSVKEGSAEFQLLTTKLGDANDQLAQSNAKSRDFLATLGLIPGPIGQIASQLNGAIGALKLFSGFSFKDVRFQLKELNDDLGDIIKGFTSFGKVAVEAKDTGATALNTAGEKINTAAVADNTKQQVLNADAKLEDAKDTAINTLQVDRNTIANLENTIALRQSQAELIKLAIAEQNAAVASGENTAVRKINILAQQQETVLKEINTLETQKNTVAKNVNTAATNAATTATILFNLALKALGIGLVIGALIAIGNQLYRLVDQFFAVSEASKAFKEGMSKGALAAQEATNKVLEVGAAFEQAKTKAISKTKALEIYNDVLGGTIGKADTLSEAEKLYEANTNNYIKSVGLRAEAQELFSIAAKQSAEAIIAEERGFFSFERNIGQSYEDELKQRREKLTNSSTEIRAKAIELLKQANSLETGFKPKTDTKKDDTAYQKRLSDLDAQIQLEINLTETRFVELTKLYDEKAKMIIDHDKLTYYQAELLRQENDKKVKDAVNEDIKRRDAYLAKIDDLETQAISDAQRKEETARVQKLNQDINNLNFDEEFLRASLEEQGKIRLDIETKYDQDILDIKDKFFKEKYKKEQEAFLKEQELRVKNKEQELATDQQRIDDKTKFVDVFGDFFFGNKGLKAIWEQYSVDLRKVYQDEYDNDIERFRLDEELLKTNLANKGITQATYDEQIIQLNDKRVASSERNTSKQLELDKIEVDSRRASADALVNIGSNLVGLLGALNKKSKDMQIAAAIVEAGVAIAKVIIDTQRSIIAYKASVALLGPVGEGLALQYAVRSKIGAAIAIATIVASGIGKLNSLKDTGGEGGGGGQQSSSTTRGMARGGMIGGKRHAQGGTMIEAEQGEAVLTRGAVSMFGPMLSMMNQAGGGVSFNSNLMTTRQDNPILSNPAQDQAPIVVKTYVVEKDMVSQINKQARLKDLSTL